MSTPRNYYWYHGLHYDYVVYNAGNWGITWSYWMVPGTARIEI